MSVHLMCTGRWLPCYCPQGMDTSRFHFQHLHGWMSAPGYCWTHGAPVSSSAMLYHCNIFIHHKNGFFNIEHILYLLINILYHFHNSGPCFSHYFFPKFTQSWESFPNICELQVFSLYRNPSTWQNTQVGRIMVMSTMTDCNEKHTHPCSGQHLDL